MACIHLAFDLIISALSRNILRLFVVVVDKLR